MGAGTGPGCRGCYPRDRDDSMQEWIGNYTCSAWIFVGSKPHPFGNERHTIACELFTIMWFAEIVEVRSSPRDHRRPEFDEIDKTLGTILRFTRPIWNCAKVVIMDSGFYVTKALVELRKKGVLGAALVQKRRYWTANIKGDKIDAHFSPKEVGNVDEVKQVDK